MLAILKLMLILLFHSLQGGDPDECEINSLNVKIKEVRRCLGFSLVRKIKSESSFLTSSPIKAVRDALKGHRSAVRKAAETRRRDL